MEVRRAILTRRAAVTPFTRTVLEPAVVGESAWVVVSGMKVGNRVERGWFYHLGRLPDADLEDTKEMKCACDHGCYHNPSDRFRAALDGKMDTQPRPCHVSQAKHKTVAPHNLSVEGKHGQ